MYLEVDIKILFPKENSIFIFKNALSRYNLKKKDMKFKCILPKYSFYKINLII